MTVTYRLAPKYHSPPPFTTSRPPSAGSGQRGQVHIDPDRIGVTGGSAGGHLAQFLAVTADVKEFEGDGGNAKQSSRVACVVNYYGPSDFTKSYGKSVDAAEVLPLFLGGNLETARTAHPGQSALLGDAERRADVVHPRHRGQIRRPRAGRLDDRSAEGAGVEAELLTLEGAGHGFKDKDAGRPRRP